MSLPEVTLSEQSLTPAGRKIGCDRGLPGCLNCTRSGRDCQGYNIRLLWPDQPDGRRKVGEIIHSPVRTEPKGALPRYYGTQFINVTSEDIVLSASDQSPDQLLSRAMLPSPRKTLTLHHAIFDQEASLLSYYERNISSMISTTQVPNGFRSELLPMALSARDMSSAALYNAMLAVSAYHHYGTEAALAYKSNAVRSLFDSLRGDGSETGAKETEIIDTQIAASMMLCVYSVFDETEGNWHMHLDGARYMLQKLATSHRRRVKSSFLLTWFLYHEVLACFTQPLRERPQDLDLLKLLEEADGDKRVIVGVLGCSTEVIEVIHRINRLRAVLLRRANKDQDHKKELTAQRITIEERLNSVTQTVHAKENPLLTPLGRVNILSTAELYRLAAYLYLSRVIPRQDDDTSRPVMLSAALSVLDKLEVATSPWPLFIIACEATSDDSRLQIMRVFDKMEIARGIGNVRVMRGIVEAFWKQVDLRADAAIAATSARGREAQAQSTNLTWDELLDCDIPVPWFI